MTNLLLIISTLSTLTILTLVWLIYKPPKWLIRWLQARYPDVVFHTPIHTDEKIVALTIDDGPSRHTREIQRLLKAHGGVKATFFVIGAHIPGHEETLRELVLDGHELANHAMHDEPSAHLPLTELARQIQMVERQIHEIYASLTPLDLATFAVKAKPPKYFRPGSGFFNVTMLALLAQPFLNYRLVLGSIYPWDAQISWPGLNAWHVLSSLTPGAIIVIHDREWTAPMLRIVLPELRRRGWRVGTVTDLLRHSTEAKVR
ncbi:uncharacterized protein Z520_04374 [Fonsecaea multimorphosa CBS 102226]|uniref:chitin deacetylase n=1 Tax=Fonsecaea multimorphosa CBS 102226 TaxID=1442371 RepID=A0A0D2KSM5_9EURO|nr:uncharacterized protein Z520_04374 [Fonsecaea multimorphosa CBS 102226]KIX99738.1 hypothetical protein Z520_04374 [Fonsecaea multimorphosa CBS 102226]OAL26786.1 hypothetical protein AYO22_04139 [Fonsecaea multimorphosa]